MTCFGGGGGEDVCDCFYPMGGGLFLSCPGGSNILCVGLMTCWGGGGVGGDMCDCFYPMGGGGGDCFYPMGGRGGTVSILSRR